MRGTSHRERGGTFDDRAAIDASFQALRVFNRPELHPLVGLRHRVDERVAALFPGDGVVARLVRALVARRAVDIKELCEAFETVSRTRKALRGPVVADLCGGHGLAGAVLAVLERDVERVVVLDRRRPDAHDSILDAVAEVAPRAAAKVAFIEANVSDAAALLAPGSGLLAVHACGARTDRAIDAALALGSPVALLPCCYFKTANQAPPALRRGLGARDATDTARTYRLEAAGWDVRWQAIPRAVTAMNRLIVATPRGPRGQAAA